MVFPQTFKPFFVRNNLANKTTAFGLEGSGRSVKLTTHLQLVLNFASHPLALKGCEVSFHLSPK